jgi:maltooligosyltrehalose trehalohydrolase
MTALWLLGPQTPLFFQGQEYAASTPFVFFADHEPELGRLVAEGRAKFLAIFPSLASPEAQTRLPDPRDIAVFERCKLRLEDGALNRQAVALHLDLLRLRREDAVIRRHSIERLEAAVLSADCLAVRFFGDGSDDRLILCNFGGDLLFAPVTEPLLAPPEGKTWALLWSSENPRYGGAGTAAIETEHGWQIPGEATVVMK